MQNAYRVRQNQMGSDMLQMVQSMDCQSGNHSNGNPVGGDAAACLPACLQGFSLWACDARNIDYNAGSPICVIFRSDERRPCPLTARDNNMSPVVCGGGQNEPVVATNSLFSWQCPK